MYFRYDIFIAHSSADIDLAERLYAYTAGRASVFLASRSLLLGDDWDIAIPAAQLASRVTVVLISPATSTAYYARDEVRAAIDLSRSAEGKHRVVPIFTSKSELGENGSHYGLKLKHGIVLGPSISLSDAADKLISLTDLLRQCHDRPAVDCPRMASTPSALKQTAVPDIDALRSIHRYLRTAKLARLAMRETIACITDQYNTEALEAKAIVETLILKKYLSRTSGDRVEISLAGLNLLTSGH